MAGVAPRSARCLPPEEDRAEADAPSEDVIVALPVKNTRNCAVELAEFLLAVLDNDRTST